MKTIRYTGEFVNVKGETWKCEIWQEGTWTPTEISFDGDSPLTIEWDETSKEEVLCGATATLQVYSDIDRQFIDLYAEETGKIVLKTYKNGEFFWEGGIDCETYEEPYQEKSGYVVTLTFTDFGQLERTIFRGSGTMSVRDYVDYARSVGGLTTSTVQVKTILHLGKYSIKDGEVIETVDPKDTTDLTDIGIPASNFYSDDADSDNDSVKDALEAVLQPLALKMVQREGKMYVFDLYSLYNAGREFIEWDGDEQTLGVDQVYKRCTVSLTGNATTDILTQDIECGNTSAKSTTVYSDTGVWSNEDGGRDKARATYASFEFKTAADGKGLEYIHPRARYFKTSKAYEGSDDEGVAWLAIPDKLPSGNIMFSRCSRHTEFSEIPYCKYVADALRSENCVQQPYAKYLLPSRREILFQSPKYEVGASSCYLGAESPISGKIKPKVYEDYNRPYLRLSLSLLMESRYNWLNENGAYNEPKLQQYLQNRLAIVYIPYSVVLFDEADKPIYYYRCKPTIGHSLDTPVSPDCVAKQWCEFPYGSTELPAGELNFLAFYDGSKRTAYCESGNMDGWTKNQDFARFYSFAGDTSVYNGDEFPPYTPEEGELIPLPPVAGKIQITIYAGANIYCKHDDVHDADYSNFPIVTKTTYFIDDPTEQNMYDGYKNMNSYKDIAPTPSTVRKYGVGFYNASRIFGYLRWWLYKDLKLELVRGTAADDFDSDDVEYTAYVDSTAFDELSIETKCGTYTSLRDSGGSGIYQFLGDASTMQKCADIAQSGYMQYAHIYSLGTTPIAEHSLIGVALSQFNKRRTTLEGECLLPSSYFRAFSEANQGDLHYMIKSEYLDAMAGTSEIKFVELAPVEWSETDIENDGI